MLPILPPIGKMKNIKEILLSINQNGEKEKIVEISEEYPKDFMDIKKKPLN